MSRAMVTYVQRLRLASLGRPVFIVTAADGTSEAALKARVGGLELDLRDRDEWL